MQWARDQIQELLENSNEQHGWQVPKALTQYQSQILASFIDRPHWRPEPSYAEQYMQAQTTAALKTLAETCWFTRAVFPELMSTRGITHRYYTELGQGCYERIQQRTQNQVAELMSRHFEFLAETAYTAVRLQGELRQMWEL